MRAMVVHTTYDNGTSIVEDYDNFTKTVNVIGVDPVYFTITSDDFSMSQIEKLVAIVKYAMTDHDDTSQYPFSDNTTVSVRFEFGGEVKLTFKQYLW